MKTIMYACVVSLLAMACSHPDAPQATSKNEGPDTTQKITADCATLLKQAKKMDSILLVSNDVNKPLAEQAIEAFDNYATSCKNDTIAPVYLLKGGQVAQSIMEIQKSQVLFKRCVDEFHDFRNRGAALFMLAQLYDEHSMLNNEDEAKKLYEQIIKEYPNSPWEKEAKAAIANLGKSDEELIKEFNKKNKHS